MSAANRRKGHEFERALARRWGVRTTRNTRPGVHEDAGDIPLPGLLVEAKNHGRWSVDTWFGEAESKATAEQAVALVLKRRRRPLGDSLVVITLDVFDELRSR